MVSPYNNLVSDITNSDIKRSVENSFQRHTFITESNSHSLTENENKHLSLPGIDALDKISLDYPSLSKYHVTTLYSSSGTPADNCAFPNQSTIPDLLCHEKVCADKFNKHVSDCNMTNKKSCLLIENDQCSDIRPFEQVIGSGNVPLVPHVISNISKLDHTNIVVSDADGKLNSSQCYENWTLHRTKNDSSSKSDSTNISNISNDAVEECFKSTLALQSVILEFDPLYNSDSKYNNYYNSSGDLNLINYSDNNSETGSAPISANDSNLLVRIESNSNMSDVTELKDTKQDQILNKINKAFRLKRTNSSLTRWSSMKRAIKVVSDSRTVQNYKQKSVDDTAVLEKPKINSTLSVALHNGYLLKSSSGEKSKDFVQRWCQLCEGKFFYSTDKSTSKDFIDLNSVLSVQIIQDHKMKNDGTDLYCFEINVSFRSRSYIFGALCTTERRVWMQKLLENMTSAFPVRYSTDYHRSGWCYIKEGVNCNWASTWILLQRRTFVYMQHDGNIKEVDLRKARFVGLQDMSEKYVISESKSALLLDTVDLSLYLLMEKSNEITEWMRVIRAASVNNGVGLVDQQLTKDDIPVVVDKCVNFVYAHGSMSEGIYRRSGSNLNITKLLSLFRQDAWAVQISRQDYTEYDVATMLKRFFRDLPEPLLPSQLHKHLFGIYGVNCSVEDKLSLYRSVLEQFSPVNYVTIRKLMGHLNFIHEQRKHNLMSAENLSAVWGPTLMHIEDMNTLQWSKEQSEVMSDLILLYPKLFLIDDEELERENKMRDVLEKYYNSAIPLKPSGDLKMDPNKDCASICNELANKMNTEPYLLCLHEYVCNGELWRPMHHKERPFDVVLRWSYWDEVDRRDNYLVIKDSSVLQEVIPLVKPTLSVSGELKFADKKSKSFKNHLFEFSQSKLSYYKDKKGFVKIKEWNVEDILWYIGCELKRDPHTRWALTFIEKNGKQNRSKEQPYFGYTIAGTNKEEQLKWIAAILVGQYSYTNILPPVTLLQ